MAFRKQSFIEQRLDDCRLVPVASALGLRTIRRFIGQPSLELNKCLRRNRSHQGHASSGRNDHMFEARSVGQHTRPHGLNWPKVTLIIGESKRVGVVSFRLASQEVDLKALGIDGGLDLAFFTLKGAVRKLEHS